MEASAELTPPSQKHPILESLGIPEKQSGKPIGTLIVCGQGPVQDSATKVKLESLDSTMPGRVSEHEANTWMRLIARAAGELNKEGDVGLIITSGKDTGGKYVKDGESIAPTEAELMGKIIKNLSGEKAQVEFEQEAKNTLFNIINAANIIDAKREVNPNDSNLENTWILGSHFHGPRLKILASLFGFDPAHVLSAEKVLTTASQLKQQERGGKKLPVFDRQEALQNLIKARLSGEQINDEGQSYFQRKQERAGTLLDRTIEEYLKEKGVSDTDIIKQKEEIEKKLFIEEQKDAQTRMRAERRWVRGLAMEADYVLPYSVYLKNDGRLKSFLLKFDSSTLQKYGIAREELEDITPQTEREAMKRIRTRIDPNRWSWQVVKAEWENEDYPSEVKERFASLNISKDDIDSLSKAEVSILDKENMSNQIETERKKTTINFLRHAPTQWSKDHKVQGKTDTDILPGEVAAYLEKVGARNLQKPDIIVVSELKRTHQTADALKKMRDWSDLVTIVNSAFNERSWGILEGKTHEEVRAILSQSADLLEKYPYLKDGEFERIWSDPDFKVEGSESLNELAIKVNSGMIELSRRFPGKNILLITHAGDLQTQGFDFNSISKASVEESYSGEKNIKRD